MDLFLIGVDDTDNLETRGTGFRARELGQLLRAAGLGVEGVTRHQLLVDPRIPYTSHNSSACLAVRAPQDSSGELLETCREYLVRESAPGSDVGLCVSPQRAAGAAIQQFGQSAKSRVLAQIDALELARRHDVALEGLTGTGGGVIGALAAVGLRAGQNDGRFIWLAGVRELRGIYTAEQLYQSTRIDEIRTVEGMRVPAAARIDTESWPRPVLRGGRAVLLVQAAHREDCEWQIVPKETIKQYSN